MSLPRGTGSKKSRWMLAGIALLPILIIFLFLTYVWMDLPDLGIIENPRSDLSTQIISSDGEVIRSIYDEKHRISISLSEMSPHLSTALLSAEDIRFFNHSGVDPIAFFAIAKDLFTGRKTCGGSTITMQLARNLYDQVGKERSIFRKLKEMAVAVILERKFTKEEIAIIEKYAQKKSTGEIYSGTIELAVTPDLIGTSMHYKIELDGDEGIIIRLENNYQKK